jgi:thymidylate synthase (FAD)
MKLVDNKVEEYIQEPGIEGAYKSIVSAARICYQTDKDKMKLQPKDFVEQVLLKNAHTRPLEFGTVYLKIPSMATQPFNNIQSHQFFIWEKYPNTIWTHNCGLKFDNYWYITTNMRVIMQGDYSTDKEAWEHEYDKNWLQDVYDFWCEPTEFHDKRRTFTMWMSRGCTDDNRTHITMSSICESTRFCNYSKGKFGNEMTFIDPVWWKEINPVAYDKIIDQYRKDEIDYLTLSMVCPEAQQLKRIIPLGIKAELRLCGFDDAWYNFFWRRCDEHADPECVIVADKIKEMY